MNTITVARFNRREDAEPLRERLAKEGFQAQIHDELGLERLWFASKPMSGVRLEVPAADFERAYDLLLKWDDTEGALRRAIRCPECKSLRVQFPQHARRSLITNIALGPLVAIGALKREYYCEDCHFTWPREGAKPSRKRPHQAPYYFIEGIEQQNAHPRQA